MYHHTTGNTILPARSEQHLGYIKMHQRKFNFCQSNVIEMDNVWNAWKTNGSNWSIASRESRERSLHKRGAARTLKTTQNKADMHRTTDMRRFACTRARFVILPYETESWTVWDEAHSPCPGWGVAYSCTCHSACLHNWLHRCLFHRLPHWFEQIDLNWLGALHLIQEAWKHTHYVPHLVLLLPFVNISQLASREKSYSCRNL